MSSKRSRSSSTTVKKSGTTTCALLDAHIPTIDIIDFKYPYWHKADDLPENCSAESLEEVGRVVTTWLTVAAPSLANPGKPKTP